ncbi:MAG: YabP/YqfC family sporulation protein [Clostridia bacterium]|nr:YabP/YqfC family sporulation protein [Clostridia bacterium]
MERKNTEKRRRLPTPYPSRVEAECRSDGQITLLLCGVRRIVAYTDEQIVFQMKSREYVSILGKTLNCNTYYSGAVRILGRIDTIDFHQREAD